MPAVSKALFLEHKKPRGQPPSEKQRPRHRLEHVPRSSELRESCWQNHTQSDDEDVPAKLGGLALQQSVWLLHGRGDALAGSNSSLGTESPDNGSATHVPLLTTLWFAVVVTRTSNSVLARRSLRGEGIPVIHRDVRAESTRSAKHASRIPRIRASLGIGGDAVGRRGRAC